MDSRNRILNTISGNEIDRVPVTLFIHDEGNFLSQIYKNLDTEDPLDCKHKVIDLQRELGLDIFLRMLHKMTPFWITYGGLNTDEQTENWEVTCREYKRGSSIVKDYKIKTPINEFNQEFTISEIAPQTFNYACTKKPINTIKDLEASIKYEPPMDEMYPKILKDMVMKINEYLKDDGVTSIWAPGCAFNAAANLINLDMLYSVFLTDIFFFEKLMYFCMKRTFPFIEAICKSGIDIINLGGNVPGGFLGKENYDKYVLSYEKKYIELIKSHGVLTLYHNCGQASALVDSYKELGSDIVEPFSPPPLGDSDLQDIKKRSEGKFVIIGNIDQVNVLKEGTIDLVKDITQKTIMVGKKGGKFILQNADYLEYGTPWKNVKAYIEKGLGYGRY
ncbi:MAG: uroporphyrinogen decarboxylase family protein [Candidatus Humimicrobiaceae bacterium]